MYSWGNGQNGRLGHGDEVDLLSPKVIEGLLGKGVRSISCGHSHSAAVTCMHAISFPPFSCSHFSVLFFFFFSPLT